MTPADISRLVEALPALPPHPNVGWDSRSEWTTGEREAFEYYGRQCAAARDDYYDELYRSKSALIDMYLSRVQKAEARCAELESVLRRARVRVSCAGDFDLADEIDAILGT